MPGPPANQAADIQRVINAYTVDIVPEESPKDYFQENSIEWDTVYPHLLPKMPKRHNYGLGKEKGKMIDKYLLGLREKPPIEYVAEFLCNIFHYEPKTDTHEAYFCDGMGRTFYETILHLFSSRTSTYDNMSQLRTKFTSRARNSRGDFACFGSNSVTVDEMREFIHFFYNYFQENHDLEFNYFTFHYYYRTDETGQRPIPELLNEFMNH
jgi:hypothetical protein